MRWRRCAWFIADSGQKIVAKGFSRLKQISWIEEISLARLVSFPSWGPFELNQLQKRLRHLTHFCPLIPEPANRFLSVSSSPCPVFRSRPKRAKEKEGEKETREKTAGQQDEKSPSVRHTRAGTGTGADEMHMSIDHLKSIRPVASFGLG